MATTGTFYDDCDGPGWVTVNLTTPWRPALNVECVTAHTLPPPALPPASDLAPVHCLCVPRYIVVIDYLSYYVKTENYFPVHDSDSLVAIAGAVGLSPGKAPTLIQDGRGSYFVEGE